MKAKHTVILLLILSLCMTASPIVILANHIKPFVFGLPFFFFWNIFWPTIIFVLTIIYIRIKNNEID